MIADHRGRRWGVGVAIAWLVVVAPRPVATQAVRAAPDVAVKAALLFNFAKFTVWPALPPGTPILVCVIGDGAIGMAFATTTRGQRINGHALDMASNPDAATWPRCHVIFIAPAEIRRAAAPLDTIRALPTLTVSDSAGFAHDGGMIELYIEDGRIRFSVNVTAAERAGLRLSSRLLGLARIFREGDVR